MWYTPNQTLSKNRLFNFEIGGRGTGKTTGTLKYIIDKHKKDPEHKYEAVWVRRTEGEKESIEDTFFDNVQRLFFPDDEFSVTKDVGYINGEPVIRFAALTVDARRRGITSPYVRLVVFDEFIITDNTNYLRNEVQLFLSFYDTVARPSDPNRARVPALFLANAMSVVNPYFTFFNIHFNCDGRFMSRRIFAELYEDEEFKGYADTTEFADLIRGSEYYDHSINNSFILDDETFIQSRSDSARPVITFIANGVTMGMWIDWDAGKMWLSNKYDPYCTSVFTFFSEDKQPNTLSAKYFKRSRWYSIVNDAYNSGSLYFETLQLQSTWREMCKLIYM